MLLIFVPSPWNVVDAAVCLVLFCGELFFWNGTMRGRRKVVGAQTLVGEEAEVLAPCQPTGQVLIGGEMRAGALSRPVRIPGETVRVVGLSGLTLLVERL